MIPAYDADNAPTFITKNFDEPVLYAPARVKNRVPCNSLKIITAFTDCERISTHMIKLGEGMKRKELTEKISVDIILGMTKSSLSRKKHNDICRLIRYINASKNMPKLSCHYVCGGSEVHSKIYIWTRPKFEMEVPICAFCGSLNYTTNAFYKRRESVAMCNPISAYFFYQELLPDTVDCFDPLAVKRIKNTREGSAPDVYPDDSESEYLLYDSKAPVDTLKISLLRADGKDTGYGSGVNWGIRKDGTKRDPNQAYIPYNRRDKKDGFFPDRIHSYDENCPMFKVITRDFGSFHMRMAQQGNKALHSVENNAILGEWIRKRIHVPSGGYITKEMLEQYGKTYVVFRKYSDGTYLLDF